jgi:hypothetical protein
VTENASQTSCDSILFRSSNGGVNWTIVANMTGICHSVKISPSFTAGSGMVFVSGYHFGLIRSIDGGNSFKEMWIPPGGIDDNKAMLEVQVGHLASSNYVLARAWEDNQKSELTGFAIRQQGNIYLSKDSGLTFSQILPNNDWMGMDFVGKQSVPIIVAVSVDSLMWSNNEGMTWKNLSSSFCSNLRPGSNNTFKFGRSGTSSSDTSNELFVGFKNTGGIRLRWSDEGDLLECIGTLTHTLSQNILPGASHVRGLGNVVSHPPFVHDNKSHGLVFGLDMSQVIMSKDSGSTWVKVASIPADNSPPMCSVNGSLESMCSYETPKWRTNK